MIWRANAAIYCTAPLVCNTTLLMRSDIRMATSGVSRVSRRMVLGPHVQSPTQLRPDHGEAEIGGGPHTELTHRHMEWEALAGCFIAAAELLVGIMTETCA